MKARKKTEKAPVAKKPKQVPFKSLTKMKSDYFLNRSVSIIFTKKAIKIMVLALRTACRGTEEEKKYLRWLIRKLEKEGKV